MVLWTDSIIWRLRLAGDRAAGHLYSLQIISTRFPRFFTEGASIMLDTILELGKVLRAAPDGLKHHRYIKKAPIADEKRNPVRFWRVPVADDGSFDFAQIELLNDENRQSQLFYLNYKQSDADSTKPYLFGDIYRTITKTGEDGNFRFGDPTKKSWMALNSFQRGEEIKAMPTERVNSFRSSFRKQLGTIEAFLHEHPNVYIHFDFAGKGWHELEELTSLNQSLLGSFFESIENGYVMRVFLYKTLTPGASRSPGFVSDSGFKNRLFKDADEAMDLLYGINYSSKATIRKNDIKVIVLPRGEGLTSAQIERFFERTATSEITDKAAEAEEAVRRDLNDEMFSFLNFEAEDAGKIAQFDFIFSKAGGTQPDIDMIEISGLDYSKLSHISSVVRKKREEVNAERIQYLRDLWRKEPTKLRWLSITGAFLNILGDTTRAKKKYQSHLLKVLPEIYTGTYFNDPILLPAFIEKTEFNLRNDTPDYHFLRFDFRFLTKLQDKGDRLMELQESSSYRVGVLLGKLARGLRSEIKSFDKNYAGLLSRRITNLSDVMKLQNEINQKLIMHDKGGWSFTFSTDLSREIKNFTLPYDKNECAFGFFESYFAPSEKKHGDKDKGDNEDTIDSADDINVDEEN